MKMILFLSLLLPGLALSQTEEDEAQLEEVIMSKSEELSPEIEQQLQQEEEVLHPYGETNDWSLGGEDLPAEDYD